MYIEIDSNNNVIASGSLPDGMNNPIEVDSPDTVITFQYGYNYVYSNGAVEKVKEQFLVDQETKNEKLNRISMLVVTISTGKQFDGDEVSQERMVRAIQTAGITGLTETQWKLADNTIVTVTLDELKEALALSAQEMSRIWLEQSEE